MNKLLFKQIFFHKLLLILFYWGSGTYCYAQAPPFECFTDDVLVSSQTQQRTGGGSCAPGNSFGSDLTPEEIQLLPEITVYINIHYIGSDDGNFVPNGGGPLDGINYADGFIRQINKDRFGGMRGLAHNPISLRHNPPLNDFIGDARIRVALYKESGNSNDQYGGIWFWENQAEFDAATLEYEDKVLNVIFRDRSASCPTRNPLCCRQGEYRPGSCGQGGSKTQMVVTLFNAYQNSAWQAANPTITDLDTEPCGSRAWNYANLFLHELGHACGLNHAWFNGNRCSIYPVCEDAPGCNMPASAGSLGCDIDPIAECNRWTCGSTNPSGGGHGCSNWNSGSNNIMASNGRMSGLSTCQWGIMYEFLSDVCYAEIGESPCVENPEPLEINEDTNWDTERVVNRPIIVKSGTTLTVQCKVLNSTKTYYEVEQGARLIIDGGVLSNLCPQNLWRGVYVLGNYHRPHSQVDINNLRSDDPGVVTMINEGCIEFARTGISTKKGRWNFGGIIQSTGGIFRNNQRAVEFMEYPHENISHFTDTQFFTDSEAAKITDGTPGKVGVTMYKVSGVYFSGSNFHDLKLAGLYSIDADYFVLNGCEFRNIEDYGIKADRSSPFKVNNKGVVIAGAFPESSGIYRWVDFPTPNDEISNTFSGCNIAVDLMGVSNAYVTGSTFESNDIGVAVTGESYFHVRLNTFNCHRYGVKITNTGKTPFSVLNEGNDIFCNNHSKTEVAIVADGNNDGTHINFEEFSAGIDILLTPGNNSSIAKEQGNRDEPRFNRFTPNGVKISANIPGDTKKFEYFYPENFPQFWAECDDGTFPDRSSCRSVFNNYTNRADPIEEIRHCDNGESRINHLLTSDCNNIDCLQSLSIDLSNAIDSYNETEEESGIDLINNLTIKRNYLRDSLVYALAKENDYTSIENLLSETGFEDDLKLLIGTQLEFEKYAEALHIINNFEPETEDVSDFFKIQNINLAQLTAPSTYTPTIANLNVLKAIFLKNNKNSGYAAGVHYLQSGTILRKEPIEGEGSLPCQATGGSNDDDNYLVRQQNTNGNLQGISEPFELKAIPNPAKSEFSLYFEEEVNGTLTVINAVGKTVYSIPVINKSNINIAVSDWIPGIYFIRLESKSNQYKTGKLLINN